MVENNEATSSSWALPKDLQKEDKKEHSTNEILMAIFGKLCSIESKLSLPIDNVNPSETKVEPEVDVRKKFDKEFEDVVSIIDVKDEGTYFCVKPIGYLGAENFKKLTAHTNKFKARYIKGADAHFEIDKSVILKSTD